MQAEHSRSEAENDVSPVDTKSTELASQLRSIADTTKPDAIDAEPVTHDSRRSPEAEQPHPGDDKDLSRQLEGIRLATEQSEARRSIIEASKKLNTTGDTGSSMEPILQVRSYFESLGPDEDLQVHIQHFIEDSAGQLAIPLPSETVPILAVRDQDVVYLGQDGRPAIYQVPEVKPDLPDEQQAAAHHQLETFLNFTKQADKNVPLNEQTVSEAIRQRILTNSRGTIDTFEVATKDAVDSADIATSKAYTKIPESWTDVHKEIHKQYLDTAFQGAVEISTALEAIKVAENNGDDVKPSVLCMRGSCGSGKTTAAKDILQGTELRGAIAPDQFKTLALQDNDPDVTSGQVHLESTALAKWHADRVFSSSEVKHIVVDKLLDEPGDTIDLLQKSEQSGRDISYLDADVPLLISCMRVLTRSGGGEDPSIPFEGVASSFSKIRQNRASLQEMLVEAADSHAAGTRQTGVSEYRLVAWDEQLGTSIQVGQLATNENGQNSIQPIAAEDPSRQQVINSLFTEVTAQTAASTAQEVSESSGVVITEEFVDSYIGSLSYMQGEGHAEDRAKLRQKYLPMLGKTIHQAMKEKAEA